MRPSFLWRLALTALILVRMSPVVYAQSKTGSIIVDANAQTTPFPHFWEQMFGSGHAILSLRAGYRNDLRAVKKVTDFRYVRFHGILDHEVGVYNQSFPIRK